MTYNAKVEEVLVEDDRAVGVRLSDGRELRADIVVSACDGRTTMMELLKGRYLNEAYRRLYTRTIREPGMVFPGYFTLFLGLRRDFPDADPCTTYLLDESEAAALTGIRHPSVNVQFRSRRLPRTLPARDERRVRHLLLRHRSLARPGRRPGTGHPQPGRAGTAHASGTPRPRVLRGQAPGPRDARRLPGTAAPGHLRRDRRPRRVQSAHPGPLHGQLRRDRARVAAVRGERGDAGEAHQTARPGPAGAAELLPVRCVGDHRRPDPRGGGGPATSCSSSAATTAARSPRPSTRAARHRPIGSSR